MLAEIITAYKNVISKTKENKPGCEIVILSACSAEIEIYPDQLNEALSVMAKDLDCKFADITPSVKHNLPYIRAFEMLKPYIRNRKISFFDAMNMVHI